MILWVAAALAQDEPVVVGSKTFTESRLLGEVMAQLIEGRTEIPVERKLGLGGTTIVYGALESGEVDLYPEYTGTGWAVHLGIEEPVRDPLRAFGVVQQRFRDERELLWLAPFGFNNTYAMALRDEVAAEHGITKVSELAGHPELRAGVSHEFLEREDGWPGLAEAYGLQVDELRGMDHGLAYEALRSGEIDLIDAYSTDGKLARFPVRVLADDLRYFPPYDCAPLVRADLLERHPELGPLLGELAFSLSDAEMAELNAAVEVDGRAFEEVAASFLSEQGLLDAAAVAEGPDTNRDADLGTFVAARTDLLLRLLGEHLALTGTAVLLAILTAVPLGVAVSRRRALRPLLTVAGVLQTIPGLALLALLIPLLGLGWANAIAALFLYALLPILQNTATGLDEVDASLLEAGRGMGLTEGQLLRHVLLPLAMPTILAGVRTSTVISVGVATLAAFIGAGGLGEPIVTGLALNDTRLVLLGAVPAAALAVLVDLGLAALGRAATPRGLRT